MSAMDSASTRHDLIPSQMVPAFRASTNSRLRTFTGPQARLLLALFAAGCAGQGEKDTNNRDSATTAYPCDELIYGEEVYTLPSSGDTPSLDSNYDWADYPCEPGSICYDSYIFPTTRPEFTSFPASPLAPSALLYIAEDDTTTQSAITNEQYIYDSPDDESPWYVPIWGPTDALRPSTRYELWRQFDGLRPSEPVLCYDMTLVTSPHGSPLSLPSTDLPVMGISVNSLFNLYQPYILNVGLWLDDGGPDFALEFGEVSDGMASVRVAATDGDEQSWCHATLDTVVAMDDNGRFQIPGVPWRGVGSGSTDPVDGSDLQNLLAEPFTISGHLAPDGQNAIVTFDDVLLDFRLAGKGCNPHELESFDVKCPDGEICCMDMSTGPTITEPSPLTSLETIAQDNCHPRCPTSADNPDCTLP